MKKKLLTIKILVTEQKVKFYDSICRVCEKIEKVINQHRNSAS